MDKANIHRTIVCLVAELCGVPVTDIRDDGELLGYGLDSVRLVDLMDSLEAEFGTEIDELDPALADIKTILDLVQYMNRALSV